MDISPTRIAGRPARLFVSHFRAIETAIQQEISVAGCDPAIFLAGEYLRRHKDETTVVGWPMGSMAALQALQRGEVHIAGLHLFDPSTGESNLPFLRQHLKGSGYEVVTFATWEEGFLVRPGNPLSIRTAADLAEPDGHVGQSGRRLWGKTVARSTITNIRGRTDARSRVRPDRVVSF